jgi:cardiolipin synthase
MKDWKKEVFTIPNLLSMFRLILIPVYISLYLNAKEPKDYLIAAIILAVSCLTDMIDGKVARHFNMISKVGKVLDPIADKLTQFSLMICLAIKHPSIIPLMILFFVKEVYQLIAAILAFRRGWMLKGAQFSGKICTTVLFISLTIMVLIPNLDQKIIHIMTAVDFIFLAIAFVDYARVYFAKGKEFERVRDENE